MGSNSAVGQTRTKGCAISSSPQMPESIQTAPTHHRHQGQRFLLQLALDTLGDVSDVRQGKVLELLWAQVPRMGLK